LVKIKKRLLYILFFIFYFLYFIFYILFILYIFYFIYILFYIIVNTNTNINIIVNLEARMSLCKYKSIFGEPNTGLHSYRIFNIAIFDVLSTILVGVIIHQIIIVEMLKMNNTIKLWMVLVVLFIVGIISHRVFCVKSTVDKLIFGE
jgi:hypothetical protein